LYIGFKKIPQRHAALGTFIFLQTDFLYKFYLMTSVDSVAANGVGRRCAPQPAPRPDHPQTTGFWKNAPRFKRIRQLDNRKTRPFKRIRQLDNRKTRPVCSNHRSPPSAVGALQRPPQPPSRAPSPQTLSARRRRQPPSRPRSTPKTHRLIKPKNLTSMTRNSPPPSPRLHTLTDPLLDTRIHFRRRNQTSIENRQSQPPTPNFFPARFLWEHPQATAIRRRWRPKMHRCPCRARAPSTTPSTL
jgi:hypothetical protein